VAFEDGPSVGGDAKIWTPGDNAWVHCPGSTGIGGQVLFNEDGYEYRGFPDHELPARQQKLSEHVARRRDYTAAALEKECVSCAAPVGEPCNPECPATAYSRAEGIKLGERPHF